MEINRRIRKLLCALLVSVTLVGILLFPAERVSAAPVDLEDGRYMIEVVLEGGSGRASVTTPCDLVVDGGNATASIEWSSPYYDYMIVDGETYLPVNEEGNSVFEIPVAVFDEPVSVTADTTAMSVPHEIEYTLTFDSESAEVLEEDETSWVWIVFPIVFALVVGTAVYRKRNTYLKNEK